MEIEKVYRIKFRNKKEKENISRFLDIITSLDFEDLDSLNDFLNKLDVIIWDSDEEELSYNIDI